MTDYYWGWVSNLCHLLSRQVATHSPRMLRIPKYWWTMASVDTRLLTLEYGQQGSPTLTSRLVCYLTLMYYQKAYSSRKYPFLWQRCEFLSFKSVCIGRAYIHYPGRIPKFPKCLWRSQRSTRKKMDKRNIIYEHGGGVVVNRRGGKGTLQVLSSSFFNSWNMSISMKWHSFRTQPSERQHEGR